MDFLSVIKFNSSYIELVDRWYSIRGLWAWLSVALGGLSLIAGGALLYAVFLPFGNPMISDVGPAIFLVVLSVIFFLIAWFGAWYAFKIEYMGYTHYPIRLNRKTRQVHVFRQNGTVLTVPWDSLFLTLGESKNPLSGTTYDLRAHVLDADGETVRESFSLGYPSLLGNAESIDKFWAFLQPYMEAEDGVERTFQHLEAGYLMPVDGRREGWCWSIVQNYAWTGHWPWLQFIASPVLGLNAIGRIFAMWTSKVPEWPAEVEQESQVGADDPYALTWRDNGPIGWWEFYWPLVCTIVGVTSFVGVIVWIVSDLWR
ncbi:hypothetical protein BJB45_08865 [Halomonas huangheensis]|uniref:DUF6708 domain-containing protein n=2 Tax=Halomonas huangheensis TaxID=1178482 RepID=W1N991_9GAMM|nr:hypothetical protein AR456_18135 [Halomonas huangheensis]ERL52064.1 hypothetical protein BJB45_08865 [Halomonas huangheensis]